MQKSRTHQPNAMAEIDKAPIDPNQPLKRLSISGQVTLQRKTYWVTRYAEIKDSYFSYKRDASK